MEAGGRALLSAPLQCNGSLWVHERSPGLLGRKRELTPGMTRRWSTSSVETIPGHAKHVILAGVKKDNKGSGRRQSQRAVSPSRDPVLTPDWQPPPVQSVEVAEDLFSVRDSEAVPDFFRDERRGSLGLKEEDDDEDGGSVGPSFRGASSTLPPPPVNAGSASIIIRDVEQQQQQQFQLPGGGALLASPGSGVDAGTTMLAAVDMGTNSFHMVVVRADSQGRFQIVDVAKEDVRLGRGGSNMSVITPEAEDRAVAAIKRFLMLANTRNATMRVVATSAVREARNRRTFVDHITASTGVKVEVLSGREEACLIYLGILQALNVFEKTVLTVDIGGGSTEFVLGKAGKPLFATSLKLGHIRLSERCLGGGKMVERGQIDELRRHIRVMLADSGVIEAVHKKHFEMAIGSSGTIETLLEMIHLDKAASSSSSGNGAVYNGQAQLKDDEFTFKELSAMVKKLTQARTIEARMKIPGLSERRADVIVGGAVLLEEIFAALGIERMRVSPYALREGVIVDTLARVCENYNPSTDIRKSSVRDLARRFNIDRRQASAEHSAMLGRQILDGLQTCRTGGKECMTEAAALLSETEAELMEAATILHYVGMFISHKGYHKHSHYLIKNNEHLLGYNPMEVEVIALLAQYHRKKVPSAKDDAFAKLPKELQSKLCAMCAVMRVAVALDRCDSGAIADVHVLQDNTSCVLAVTPRVDPETGKPRDVSLEVWAARNELPYFEKIFKRKTTIAIAESHDVDTLTTSVSQSLSS